MCISFIHNSQRKETHIMMCSITDILLTLCSVLFFLRHSPCLTRNTEGWIIRFNDLNNNQFYTNQHHSWYLDIKTENISFRIHRSVYVYNLFFKTRLFFAVTVNVKKITNTMNMFHIKLKSARAYTKLNYSSFIF